ncbi:hypothetical protein GTPT_1561 [Tatumella ptyseos ATCC 33301]|uniref:Uncharacterized protein n=1 Tax=Tatumella ptyseos ATCC 33301 TaxID=1005995 RepID=A0A085JI10_9GAMM|nr:hypothetical protein GTPT_1561 [Tatumella ptyseos ATCC 33301]
MYLLSELTLHIIPVKKGVISQAVVLNTPISMSVPVKLLAFFYKKNGA